LEKEENCKIVASEKALTFFRLRFFIRTNQAKMNYSRDGKD